MLSTCDLTLFLLSLAVLISHKPLPFKCKYYLKHFYKIHVLLSKLVSIYEAFFDAKGGPYKDKCCIWTALLLLACVTLALVVSQDGKTATSLAVLTSPLIAITFMYFFFMRSVSTVFFSLSCVDFHS